MPGHCCACQDSTEAGPVRPEPPESVLNVRVSSVVELFGPDSCPAASNEGPNLIGVVGRKAGSQPDFPKYTEALKAYGVTWSVKALDKFLINPSVSVPGTAMPMLIPDDKTRADVVAYLATLKKP